MINPAYQNSISTSWGYELCWFLYRIGRRLVFALAVTGVGLAASFTLIITLCWRYVSLRWIWLSPIFLLIGGGEAVINMMFFAIANDVTSEQTRYDKQAKEISIICWECLGRPFSLEEGLVVYLPRLLHLLLLHSWCFALPGSLFGSAWDYWYLEPRWPCFFQRLWEWNLRNLRMTCPTSAKLLRLTILRSMQLHDPTSATSSTASTNQPRCFTHCQYCSFWSPSSSGLLEESQAIWLFDTSPIDIAGSFVKLASFSLFRQQ